jgi:hypothetical protein
VGFRVHLSKQPFMLTDKCGTGSEPKLPLIVETPVLAHAK